MSSSTSSIYRTTNSGSSATTPKTPRVFCAVTAVTAVAAWPPCAVTVLMSAWIPAPPPESDPATASTRPFTPQPLPDPELLEEAVAREQRGQCRGSSEEYLKNPGSGEVAFAREKTRIATQRRLAHELRREPRPPRTDVIEQALVVAGVLDDRADRRRPRVGPANHRFNLALELVDSVRKHLEQLQVVHRVEVNHLHQVTDDRFLVRQEAGRIDDRHRIVDKAKQLVKMEVDARLDSSRVRTHDHERACPAPKGDLQARRALFDLPAPFELAERRSSSSESK